MDCSRQFTARIVKYTVKTRPKKSRDAFLISAMWPRYELTISTISAGMSPLKLSSVRGGRSRKLRIALSRIKKGKSEKMR